MSTSDHPAPAVQLGSVLFCFVYFIICMLVPGREMILHCVNFVYFGAYFLVAAAGLEIKPCIVVTPGGNGIGTGKGGAIK